LTAAGKRLVEAAIKHKILIDVAHISRQAIRDIFAISKQHNYYPFFHSHANLVTCATADHLLSGLVV
jgi:microsomal dipeptidase-like Zn-dependent dipeptidase